jgi:hypothetical protein
MLDEEEEEEEEEESFILQCAQVSVPPVAAATSRG